MSKSSTPDHSFIPATGGRPARFAIVAGEASGDILGSGLIEGLKVLYPNAEFYGIGGPLMIAKGFNSTVAMEKLSVMGLVEVLSRLPELLSIRNHLKAELIHNPPDMFIGIDAPDFNLPLERDLKDQGILTAHYVSPSVWAWKKKRIFKIKKAVDLLLCLFPFEAKYYRETSQRLAFVGHPLTKEIASQLDASVIANDFKLEDGKKTIAILPGSRSSETKYLTPVFLAAARKLSKNNKQLQFIIPAANQQRFEEFQQQLTQYPDLSVKLVLGQSRQVMSCADVIMIASGTATLEAALIGKPMVVAYKMASITYAIYSRMLHTRFVSLPNILADQLIVPELLQDDANPQRIASEIETMLNDPARCDVMREKFAEIHNMLNVDSNSIAAAAIDNLLKQSPVNEI